MRFSVISSATMLETLVSLLFVWSTLDRLVVKADSSCVSSVPTIEVRNKLFFNSETGEFFPIKGVAYYPRPNTGINDMNGIDFITSEYEPVWRRDLEQLVALNVNVVRIYHVDPSLNHDDFFCACMQVGIYVIVGLATLCENCEIGSNAAPDCYSTELKTRGEYVISTFSKYSNLLAFEAGNEINLAIGAIGHPELNGPCQKKFIRDMRAFMQTCGNFGMRHIPIGVVLADYDLEESVPYYSCRSDPNDKLENTEWLGLNQYRSCDGTITDPNDLAGWQQLLGEFKQYEVPVPVVFTETGCRDKTFPTIDGYPGQRTYVEIEATFEPLYLQQFAGTVVFEYNTEKTNSNVPWPYQGAYTEFGGDFGIVYFSPEDCDDITVPCDVVRFPEFQFLAEKYGNISASDITLPTPEKYPDATQCPSIFPPLSNFTWAPDNQQSLNCPKQQSVKCDCSGKVSSDKYSFTPSFNKSSVGTPGNSTLFPVAAATTDGDDSVATGATAGDDSFNSTNSTTDDDTTTTKGSGKHEKSSSSTVNGGSSSAYIAFTSTSALLFAILMPLAMATFW